MKQTEEKILDAAALHEGHTNYMRPFLYVYRQDSYGEVWKKLNDLKNMGMYSCVIQYMGTGQEADEEVIPFDEAYFSLLESVSRACEELGMTFWVQDAAPYPTGAANGWFAREEYMDKARVFLDERHLNVKGPVKDGAVLLEPILSMIRWDSAYNKILRENVLKQQTPPDRIYKVIALKRREDCEEVAFDRETAIDLTEGVNEEEGLLQFDLPAGEYRIFFLMLTYTVDNRKQFMNLLDAESVRIQMQAVHELHYEHLKEALGKTWEGFFYDEPEVGNARFYDSLPGKKDKKELLLLPFCEELSEKLEECFGRDYAKLLPALWYDCGEITRVVRYQYMDAVTRLIEKNYNGQIFPWCRERNIKYIGHVIEDEGAHTRLGLGTGHYFRTLKYQDEAGIDLITAQLLPDMDGRGSSWTLCSDSEGDFFHYGIASLAASEAHINPNKQGRSFCEAGALYGALDDGRFYKYLADMMFVNGINRLIPALTDILTETDGKPLFDYCNRMCRLLDGSSYQAATAVMYHAEAEWAGDFQPFHQVGKVLAQNQFMYDVVPGDAFVDAFYGLTIEKGYFTINGNRYDVLVIPYSQYIREDVAEVLRKLSEASVPVLFLKALPEGYCERTGIVSLRDCGFTIVTEEELADMVCAALSQKLVIEKPAQSLRIHHFSKEGTEYYMLLNASGQEKISTHITFNGNGWIKVYDAMNHALRVLSGGKTEQGISFDLELIEYESIVLAVGDFEKADEKPAAWRPCVLTPFTVTAQDGVEKKFILEELKDMGGRDYLPRYSGVLTYKSEFDCQGELPAELNLGRVYNSAEVILNGVNLGLRIAAPYTFSLDGIVKQGYNHLEIRVKGSPARRKAANGPSFVQSFEAKTYMKLEPVGVLGPVCIR